MRTIRRDVALMALPALTSAVSLSDMTPRAQGLPKACNDVYTSEIPGCTPDDWKSRDCSSSCVAGMLGLVDPIQEACGGQGIEGDNLIVAYLAGVGPEQLCPNALDMPAPSKSKPSPYHTPRPTPTETKGTTTAHSLTDASSLAIDTSSTISSEIPSSTTTEKTRTKTTHTSDETKEAPTAEGASSTSRLAVDTSSTPTTQAGGDSTADPEPIYDDGSGGGSPFDTQGNLMNAAAGLSISSAITLLSAAIAVFAAWR